MATISSDVARPVAATILGIVAQEGTAGAAHAQALRHPRAPVRDLADAVHVFCIVHGAFPGLVDHALTGAGEPEALAWLRETADAVSAERALLAQLTAAVGPMPSTPGHAAAEAAVLAQRHALEMLARSDRSGCAWGAATGFVLDWEAIRDVLDACAARVGVQPPTAFTPVAEATRTALAALVVPPRIERAMIFGAQQAIAQHRGLWQLLESRAAARDAL